MFVKIVNKITPENSEGSVVEFTTLYGTGQARWYGSPPQLLQKYDVEFQIEHLLRWNVDVALASSEEFRIYNDKNILIFHGIFESIKPEGLATFRLGDSIIVAMTEGSPLPIGTFVEIQTHEVTLYDTNL
jgi:hypothetical protein